MRALGQLVRCAALAGAFFLADVAWAQTGNDKCTNAMLKDTNKVAATQAKEVTACVKNIGKGKVAVNESCLTADLKQKVMKAKGKVDSDYTKKCGTPPTFGPGSAGYPPAQLKSAATAKELSLKTRVFGSDIGLPGVIIDCDTDKDGCKCQQAIAKDMYKLEKTKLKECIKAIKAALKAGSIVDQATLGAACTNAILADVKGKIDKGKTKLASDVTKKCLANPFTGGGLCDASSVGTLATCVEENVECEVCLYLKRIGVAAPSLSCDLFDDGAADGSCCNMAEGAYTLTQISGGTLQVDGLPAFPFPSGGTVLQDVGPAGPGCVHDTVVPTGGGLYAPPFCVPGLGFSVTVVQTACGIGKIDDDGGSDFTITEVGDTSAPTSCAMPASACPAPPGDNNVRVDVTVGDAAVDVCSGAGSANLFYAVPVFTTTWLKIGQCPDVDGTYNPGTDTLIVSFPQILDYTSDSTNATWADLDPDSCFLSGAGPGGAGLTGIGTCLDPFGGTPVVAAATGTIGSNGAPLYDLTFVAELPEVLSGPAGPLGATCGSAPAIAIPGTVTRCIQ